MKAFRLITGLGLFWAVAGMATESKAYQIATIPDNGKGKQTASKPVANPDKYKYYEASTLSGIDLSPNTKTGTFTLKFDQQLTETGTLFIKNTAGKVLYTNLIGEGTDPLSRTLDVGKLIPGIYTIEVKTSDTTFWKKVRIRK